MKKKNNLLFEKYIDELLSGTPEQRRQSSPQKKWLGGLSPYR